MLRVLITVIVACGLATVAVRPGHALSPESLRSVVSVLPLWPGYNQGGRIGAPPGQDPEGSGVAVLPGGFIATAAHVIARATKVDVRLADGRVYTAEVVGRDLKADIALLHIDADLPTLEAAPPQSLGAPVCALSNAFGLDISVTCGVVSALNRSAAGFNPIEDFVQTDAAVNPGSSGGALVDRQGRLVGMLSAIFATQTDANIGVNFAVSRALLLRVVEDLAAYGEVRAADAGLKVKAPEEGSPLARRGVEVDAVDPEGPAAGMLEPGDKIVAAAGRAIGRPSDWQTVVYLHPPGAEIPVTLLRNGKEKHVILRLKRGP